MLLVMPYYTYLLSSDCFIKAILPVLISFFVLLYLLIGISSIISSMLLINYQQVYIIHKIEYIKHSVVYSPCHKYFLFIH